LPKYFFLVKRSSKSAFLFPAVYRWSIYPPKITKKLLKKWQEIRLENDNGVLSERRKFMFKSCLLLICFSVFSIPLLALEYVEALDGASVPCPLVELKGKVFRHMFPGVPNYQSIGEGDAPETRWVLEISASEIQRLEQAGFIPRNDLFESKEKGWVQLIAPQFESDPIQFLDHPVVVQGYLGSLIFHIHTPVAIEAVGIYDDK
jgi:hypothetical protein